jgi:hypothetical protein
MSVVRLRHGVNDSAGKNRLKIGFVPRFFYDVDEIKRFFTPKHSIRPPILWKPEPKTKLHTTQYRNATAHTDTSSKRHTWLDRHLHQAYCAARYIRGNDEHIREYLANLTPPLRQYVPSSTTTVLKMSL